MESHAKTSSERYRAVTVVSEMQFGGEMKNQDRAQWFEPYLTGCVCDGLTSSPFASDAAETVTKFAPVLFQGKVRDRLQALSDLLILHRVERIRSGFVPQTNIAGPMRQLLQEVAKEKLKFSFQTTLVTANFMVTAEIVTVRLICCGDSAFFAFSADGELLTSSLSTRVDSKSADVNELSTAGKIRFGPGDELLAKIVCDALQRPLLAKAGGIKPTSAKKWFVCAPLDRYYARDKIGANGSNKESVLWLRSDDLLLVPKYLAGTAKSPEYRNYVHFPYSPVIKTIESDPGSNKRHSFNNPGAVTAVLPDHFYTGSWSYSETKFPPDAHFVLCSDGLYGAFSDPAALWSWLSENQAGLHEPQQRLRILQQLHKRRHRKYGDDDIAFIWLCPKEPAGSGKESIKNAC